MAGNVPSTFRATDRFLYSPEHDCLVIRIPLPGRPPEAHTVDALCDLMIAKGHVYATQYEQIPRASSPKIRQLVSSGPALTRGGNVRDQRYQTAPPENEESFTFYMAQCLHYGLDFDLLFPKETAKVALRNAIAASHQHILRVPKSLRKLEAKLRRRFAEGDMSVIVSDSTPVGVALATQVTKSRRKSFPLSMPPRDPVTGQFLRSKQASNSRSLRAGDSARESPGSEISDEAGAEDETEEENVEESSEADSELEVTEEESVEQVSEEDDGVEEESAEEESTEESTEEEIVRGESAQEEYTEEETAGESSESEDVDGNDNGNRIKIGDDSQEALVEETSDEESSGKEDAREASAQSLKSSSKSSNSQEASESSSGKMEESEETNEADNNVEEGEELSQNESLEQYSSSRPSDSSPDSESSTDRAPLDTLKESSQDSSDDSTSEDFQTPLSTHDDRQNTPLEYSDSAESSRSPSSEVLSTPTPTLTTGGEKKKASSWLKSKRKKIRLY